MPIYWPERAHRWPLRVVFRAEIRAKLIGTPLVLRPFASPEMVQRRPREIVLHISSDFIRIGRSWQVSDPNPSARVIRRANSGLCSYRNTWREAVIRNLR